jgi:hypothetical protein
MTELHPPTEKAPGRGRAARVTPLVLSLSLHGGLLLLVGGAALVPAYVQQQEFIGEIVAPSQIQDVPLDTQEMVEEFAPATSNTTEEAYQAQPDEVSAPMPELVSTTAVTSVPALWVSTPGVEMRNIQSIAQGGPQGSPQGTQGVAKSRRGSVSTMFGSTEKQSSGDLEGFLWDLKQSPDRKSHAEMSRMVEATETAPAKLQIHGGNYRKVIREFITGGWNRRTLDRYYRAAEPLFANRVFIPTMKAEEAPKAFGVEKEVEPLGWFVHYTGVISAPETGEYRFVGYADDLLVVAVDGRVVLDGSLHRKAVTDWESKEANPAAGKTGLPSNVGRMQFGDWIPMKAGDQKTIDIGIGEFPGGIFMAYLLIQKKGETYKAGPGEFPLLPIFQTSQGKNDDKDLPLLKGMEHAGKGLVMGAKP